MSQQTSVGQVCRSLCPAVAGDVTGVSNDEEIAGLGDAAPGTGEAVMFVGLRLAPPGLAALPAIRGPAGKPHGVSRPKL